MKSPKSIKKRSLPHYGLARPRRKKKTDWAGVGPADAFRPNLEYYQRIPAQRLAYKLFRNIQQQATILSGDMLNEDYRPLVKPQLTPCYSTYPSALAIHAAIGLTGFLEFQQRTASGNLETVMSDFLADPSAGEELDVHPETYKKIAQFICTKVQNRVLLEDLSRHKPLASVEFYRLFTASQHRLDFHSVQDILDVCILFGDITPPWQEMNLHPLTLKLLEKIELVCTPYLDLLPTTPQEELTDLGLEWVKSLCTAIAPYLPGKKGITKESEAPTPRMPFLADNELDMGRFDRQINATEPTIQEDGTISPLDDAREPALFAPDSPMDNALKQLGASKGDDDPLADLSDTVTKASEQSSKWQDTRSDLVEQLMRESTFATGPIEGNPSAGHEVEVDLGNGKTGIGEIHDQPLELSPDQAKYEELMDQSSPITQTVKKILYPNVEQVPETSRFHTSGSIDASRLSQSPMTDTVFKRQPIREINDKRGKPVLVIACDGSGSLSTEEMGMTKVLVCSWLNATKGRGVEVLAGLYNCQYIRQGINSSLVRWMYHPRKTPAISRNEAVHALLSLPESGSGGQEDALALNFMLKEARDLARGRMVYLIHISDCGWCSSFSEGMSANKEIQAVLNDVRETSKDKLDTTLVALSREKGNTGLEGHVDRIVHVSDEELTDFPGVAQKIGTHVASIMRANKHI